jgi:hypothetical protein
MSELLDIAPATLRNWIEREETRQAPRRIVFGT